MSCLFHRQTGRFQPELKILRRWFFPRQAREMISFDLSFR